MSVAPLDYLFPVPSRPKSDLSPSHFPGISPESTETLQWVLKDNHVKWHIFFNDEHFHNHAAHRAIAAWALGAEPSTIRTGYEKDCGYEKPAIKAPEPVTPDNFEQHLGDEQYYTAYVDFFSKYVQEHGIPDTLEEFIFSRKANLGCGSNASHPWMLSRFLSGVLHPMIHTGYGAEFGMPGMIVEGLAMTAVHICPPSALLNNLDLFEGTLHHLVHSASETINTALNTTTAFVDKNIPSSLKGASTGEPPAPQESKQHALTILSRVLRDPRFAPTESHKEAGIVFDDTINKHGKAIAAYINQWAIHEADIDKSIEELVWTVTVLYGIAGWTDCKDPKGQTGHNFNADFYFMHLVTSSIFLPAICALLQPVSQIRLLKSYFTVALTWAVNRGQPSLDVEGFMSEMIKPDDAFLPDSVRAMKNLDLWMRMIEEARGHHDEHLTKTIRSLAGWAGAFGLRKARLNFAEKQRCASAAAEKASAKAGGIGRDEVEAAGLGMGMTPAEANRCKCGCTDLNPKTWRDSKNGYRHVDDANGINYRDRGGSAVAREDENVLPRTELPGSEFLDGGLFLRVGVLTLGRMGWDKNGVKKRPKWQEKDGQRPEAEFWDFKGFFEQDKQCGAKDGEGPLMAKY
ncbi:hypothetical protein BDN70DRAFT_873484 [Pholiota conissans]|uniref:Oxidoreductase AflY n=1 Tax=Pholiota conissans TaxID=109636 RepID=A0A9P5ZBU5_9AGAR|nr:hypothetical protein BDN70DRAFT_873484 [Pholiota conissans]